MQTRFSPQFLSTKQGQRADEILRSCVHCGFCNATCPTYLQSGDELEGPRGRIYLIKEMLDEQDVSTTTQQHLDSCLSCLSCETTCPSGVKYSELFEIGKAHSDQINRRGLVDRCKRWLIRKVFPQPKIFKPLYLLATWLNLYAKPHADEYTQPATVSDRVIILSGCVQSVTAPNINSSLINLLASLNVLALSHSQVQCCGAIDHHNGDPEKAKVMIRNNIDAWWPDIENGVNAILMTASGCGLTVKDYARIMSDDTVYADKAKFISAITQDVSEYFAYQQFQKRLGYENVAFHAPCTLQHGQKINGIVETVLARSGYNVIDFADAHLCCGSAGTYSLLHADKAEYFRDKKIANIELHNVDVIATANIGCLLHMQKGTEIPVKHWLELVTMEKP